MFKTPLFVLGAVALLTTACSQPSSDDPRPLPDPTVYQNQQGPYRTERVEIVLQPGDRTEVKAVMQQNQVIFYDWLASVPVYVDFHGHDPDDDSYWYRYREQEAGFSSAGSLVAPVTGEHGWYYRNDTEQEITINLRVSGYYDRIRDLGIFPPAAATAESGS